MKRVEYLKTHYTLFLKMRYLGLAKNVGCQAQQSSWSEVLASFHELILSIENL